MGSSTVAVVNNPVRSIEFVYIFMRKRAQGKGKSKKNYSLQFKSRLICLHRETIWKIEFEVLNSRLSIFVVLT